MLYKNFSVITSKKISAFNKKIIVDSDKSISIRSFLIGAISNDVSLIKNVLESEDVFSAISCLKKLGILIKRINSGQYLIFGRGLGSLSAQKNMVLNAGNSGTLARLLIGILSTTPNIYLKIRGDKSLNKRSMLSLINLMNEFGAEFLPKNKFNFPLTIISSNLPVGITYKAGTSAQLKSAAILAGLNAYGTTTVIEKEKSRNPTENILLKSKGVLNIKKNIIKINGKKYLSPLKLNVPGDPSSAAFFVALTLFTKNSNLYIKKVGLNDRRIGFYKLLKKHGAKITFKNLKKNNNETIGDIIIKTSKLKPLKASASYYPSTTDEYVILLICAALIPGVSVFKGISDLSNKESSRAYEIKKILKQIGIKSKLTKNEMKIFGIKKIKKINKIVTVPNLGDHRICMATMCLSLITGIKSNIKNFDTVNTSCPSFLKIIKNLGGKFEIKKAL